jgi:glutathione S-transferase
LDSQLANRAYLCDAEPTIADLFCYGDIAFAQIYAFDLARWTNLVGWAERAAALPGCQAPLDLLHMQDAEFS